MKINTGLTDERACGGGGGCLIITWWGLQWTQIAALVIKQKRTDRGTVAIG